MGLGKVPLGKDAGGNPPGVTLTPRFKDAATTPNTNCQAVDVKEVFESVGSKSIMRSETSLTVLKGGAAHSYDGNNVSCVSAVANHGCVRPCRVTSGAILPNAQVKGKGGLRGNKLHSCTLHTYICICCKATFAFRIQRIGTVASVTQHHVRTSAFFLLRCPVGLIDTHSER
jgi:hypothetical protein